MRSRGIVKRCDSRRPISLDEETPRLSDANEEPEAALEATARPLNVLITFPLA